MRPTWQRSRSASRAHRRPVALPAQGLTRSPRSGCARDRPSGGGSMHPTSSPLTWDRPLRAHHRSAATTGAITKAGSTHARRLLVEAAYHYRRGPVVGEALSAADAANHRDHPHLLARPTPAQRPLARSKTHATNPAGSSRSRSPANSPPTAGRSPPGPLIPTGYRRHPCRRATPSRTQPPTPEAGRRPPRLAETHQLTRTLSTSPLRLARRPTSPARAHQLRD